MISNAERRFYLFGLCSALFFLVGFILNVWNEFTTSMVLVAVGGALSYFSPPIMFIAFQSICYPDDYNHADKQYPAKYYAICFYSVATACALASTILLLFILDHKRTTATIQLFFWGTVSNSLLRHYWSNSREKDTTR